MEIPDALRAHLDEAGRFFLAGDAAGGRERQTAIAAGDGLRAAKRIASRCRGEVK
jgi:thioredoxin reductase